MATRSAVKAIGGGLAFFALLLLLLWRTNPTAITHAAKLQPGPTPLELLDFSQLTPAQRQQIEVIAAKNHPKLATFQYHSYGLFSTTSSKLGGGLASIGVLGFVIDLRKGSN